MDERLRKVIDEIREQEYRFGQDHMKYKIINLITKEIEQNDNPDYRAGLYEIYDQILKID